MKRFLSLFIVLMILFTPAFSQFFSLSDSTVTFKDKEGKLLTKDQVQQLMKSAFSIRQENINGRKIITILPSGSDEQALRQAKIEKFKSNLIDKPIATYRFKALDGKKWNSKQLEGKVVVINFWFTNCKPCIQEMPLLNELVKMYSDSSVVFLGLAPEREEQVKKFLRKYQFDYHIIPSSSDYIETLSIENFPTHLVVDKSGIIRQVFIGYSEDIKDKLQAGINKLIN